MTGRRAFLFLAAVLTAVVLIVAGALAQQAAADSAKAASAPSGAVAASLPAPTGAGGTDGIAARTVYASTAARSLVRPSLPPSASAGPTTSPSASATDSGAAPGKRSVAARSPDVSSAGKPATPGPTAEYLALRARIEWCESRNEPTAVNAQSGASGLYQFLDATFEAVTGLPGKASDYSADVQTKAFDKLYAADGTRPWNSSRSCWARP